MKKRAAMARRNRPWLVGGAVLAAVWLLAIAGIAIARSQAVTLEEVVAFAREVSLDGLSAEERRQRIDELAAKVNALEFDGRRRGEIRDAVRDRFAEMTPAERSAYIEATLPRGMQQMMQAVNEMPREERRALVERALADMRGREGEAERQRMEEEVGRETVDRIVEEGMKSFMRDASAESKLDLQPLIEQMQVNLRRPRHGR